MPHSHAVKRAENLGEEWRELGNCKGMDPNLFFPSTGEATREIKAICAGCPVQEICLEYALVSGEKFGIWGGKSEKERRRLRRVRVDPKLVPCGTRAAYERHRRRGEEACEECKAANAAHQRLKEARKRMAS